MYSIPDRSDKASWICLLQDLMARYLPDCDIRFAAGERTGVITLTRNDGACFGFWLDPSSESAEGLDIVVAGAAEDPLIQVPLWDDGLDNVLVSVGNALREAKLLPNSGMPGERGTVRFSRGTA